MCKLHFSFALSWVTLGLFSFVLVSVSGGGIPHKIKCLEQEVELKDCFKGFMECAAALMSEEDIKVFQDLDTSAEKKKEIGIKAHKNTCIRVCQWKKHQHLLNEDGSFNKTAQDLMIDSIFPEPAREGLKAGMAKCHEENHKAFSEDKQCESYKPFEKCMHKTYAETCKIDTKQFHMDEMEE